MSLDTKLADRNQPLFLYGTTPPREGSAPELVQSVAGKLIERLRPLPLDGLIVYDIQDESGRTSLPRPFPFMRTIDPREYSRLLGALAGKAVINYKSIGPLDEGQWSDWLNATHRDYGVRYLSVVGRPTSKGVRYAMSLLRAYEIAAAHPGQYTLGGVAIAERHGPGTSESKRMVDKARCGCGFFVSQAVYHSGPTIRLLRDYVRDCRDAGVAPSRFMLTFTPCGREKTLTFIKWLGITVSERTERAILSASNPLAASIDICRANLREILEQVGLAEVPIGINVESVSINKDEIDASIDLFHALAEILKGFLPRDKSRRS
jgi:hypothetical protein